MWDYFDLIVEKVRLNSRTHFHPVAFGILERLLTILLKVYETFLDLIHLLEMVDVL
tara:strand:- start:2525 stop:2692 length:168 start_codon:yes stop_codon:yes gene_type:complete